MCTYAKFKEFEIRDITVVDEVIKDEKGFPTLKTRVENGNETHRYDVVKWQEYKGEPSCFSIAFLEYNPKEAWFELKSVGLRYLEHSTEELNRYILKWCDFKAFELSMEQDDD